MPTLSVLVDSNGSAAPLYRACARGREAVGGTIGQAIDGLPKEVAEGEGLLMVLVQSFRPDKYFTAEQQKRLTELMDKSRSITDALSSEEEAELKALIDAELRGATERSAELLRRIKT